MNEFLKILSLTSLLLGAAPALAQVGPVGPKSEPIVNPPASAPKPAPPADLPYKPKVEPPLKAPPAEEHAVKQEPIPYIPSKSPESFGARDPS